MSQALTFIVLGFVSGAIYLGISLGLVTVYLASGILNFAQAAIAMWACYVFALLRLRGVLILPIGTVKLGSSVGSAPAFVIALATATALGAALHLVVFRPLRRASPMAQIVASVAVLVTIVGLTVVRFGSNAVSVPSMLPSTTYHVGSWQIGLGSIILLGLAVVLSCLVGIYFRFTTAGVATRAAAANEDALGLMGYSPHILDATAWAIASLLSTSLLILALPSTSLNASVAYDVVPALAVLLVARMRSLLVIAAASMALGSIQSLITLGTSKAWWPSWGRSGFPEGLPFLVAILVLFALGDRLGLREAPLGGGLPKVRLPRRPLLTIGVVGAISVAGLSFTTGPTRYGVITSLIMMILVMSYTVITGYLGQVSLAQIAFAGASGFMLSKASTNWGIGFPLSLLVSASFAAVIGLLIGVAALRFRGAQLAIVSLAAAVAVQAFVFNNAYFTAVQGDLIGTPRLFGVNLAVQDGQNVARIQFGVMTLVIVLLCVAALLRWARGRTGRSWLAVRSNERAAASSGINISATKITGFFLSAFLAGIAGAMIGYSQGQLSTGSFEVDAGILIFATAFLGGITSVGGAAVAGAIAPLGVFYVVLNNHVSFGKYYSLIAGLGLILTVMLNPEGLAPKVGGQLRALVARIRWRLVRRSTNDAGDVRANTASVVSVSRRDRPETVGRGA